MSEPIAIHPSSGNVFADLGIDDPDEYLAKSELAATSRPPSRPGGSPRRRRGPCLNSGNPR